MRKNQQRRLRRSPSGSSYWCVESNGQLCQFIHHTGDGLLTSFQVWAFKKTVELRRIQHHFHGIPTKNVQPQPNCKKTLDKPKLGVYKAAGLSS